MTRPAWAGSLFLSSSWTATSNSFVTSINMSVYSVLSTVPEIRAKTVSNTCCQALRGAEALGTMSPPPGSEPSAARPGPGSWAAHGERGSLDELVEKTRGWLARFIPSLPSFLKK